MAPELTLLLEPLPPLPRALVHDVTTDNQNSLVRVVLRSPLHRGATMAMFLSGLGFSAAASQIASFLVDDLGGSLTAAGLFSLASLAAPIAGYLVGAVWSGT